MGISSLLAHPLMRGLDIDDPRTTDLRRKVIELHWRWRKACNRYELVIENKGSGMSLIQDLRNENIHARHISAR